MQEATDTVKRAYRVNRGKLPSRLCDYVVGVVTEREGDPSSYKESISSIDRKSWKQSMESDMQSHIQNQSWELVQLPKGNVHLVASGSSNKSGTSQTRSLDIKHGS